MKKAKGPMGKMGKMGKMPKPPAVMKKLDQFNEVVENVSDLTERITEGAQVVSEFIPSHISAQQPRQGEAPVEYAVPMEYAASVGSAAPVDSAPPADDLYSTKVTFDTAFIEPEGAETIECWKDALRMLYNFYIMCTYNFFMFMCGVCVVTQWGITYSCLTWLRIWCLNPMTSVVLVFVKGCCPLILEPIGMFRQVCCGGRKKGAATSA